MKAVRLLIITLCASFALAGDAPLPKAQAKVYDRDGNIYMTGQDGKELQLTALGKDSHAVLSPNGHQVVFVRQVRELKDNPMGFPADDAAIMYAAWSPDEIWTMDIKDRQPTVLRKSIYEKDPKKCTGWFYDLNFSPDGKTIYYACQPGSPTTGAIHTMNSDGTGDRWVCWGQSVDVVGDGSKYHGYLVVVRKADDGAYDISVLMTPAGKEIERISEEDFWKTHQKVK
jgi:Tol biopolymer transport system component